MNIIFEGSDGVGKSTLINNLVKLTGKPVIKGSSFEISEGGAEAMFEWSKAVLLNNKDVIIDRFFYSNMVYGKMYDYPTMTPEQYEELNSIVNETAVVYYLTADTEVLIERIMRRGDEHIQPEDIEKIQNVYEEIWRVCKPKNLVEIDTTNNQILDIKCEIYQTIIKHDNDVTHIKNEFSNK